MRFCDKLPKKRKENNFSQEQLADKLGVSRQAISKWESGASYPDMDKMIQICKVLNCNLDDLMDDGVIGESTIDNKKINFSVYLKDLLKFITNIYNMFCSMTLKEKFICVAEMLFITLIICILGSISISILSSITYDFIRLIPFGISDIVNNIFDAIYKAIMIILGIIIILHLFKIRYLDYYVTIEDKNIDEKTIEKDIEQVKNIKSNEKEKIIIRDPKHSSYKFFNLLGSILLIGLKLFIVMCVIPVVFMFVSLIIMAIISLCHSIYGLLFLWISIGLLSGATLCFVVIYFAYNFVFDRTIKFKQMFITSIISLIVIGVMIGLCFISFINYKYVDNFDNVKKITDVKYIEVNENTKLHVYTDNKHIEYIIDNSLENAKIEITHIEKSKVELTENTNNEYFVQMEEYSPFDAYKVIVKDLKKHTIRNYNSSDIMKVKIYVSKNNYEILKNSHEE